ncbi:MULTISPECIES: RidA family protein [unclassified Bradyrhizobium]|uniref:RidA family protein n=1 Tax=unclassified Bradyrhizobium TaxID=2631580 RepID=UPI002915D4E0|nr:MULTISPECIES: Rid family hydrolase [unclassified Bradyrhizobium]
MDPIYHLLPDAPKPVTPYSHAVRAGPFLFVTGQLATDPDDDGAAAPGRYRRADPQGHG